MKAYDAVVIGGGPAGITAALYLLRSGASVAWAEKLAPGGQTLLTEGIDNYPGYPKGIRGYELADLFAAHLESFQFDTYTDEVNTVTYAPAASRIQVGDQWIEAKAVVICAGASHRRLGLPKEQEFTGRGVSYCALCDGNFFRDQVVAVVGGGDTALEESLYLSKLVKKIYLIHRRDRFRGLKVYQDKVAANPKIELVLHTVIEELVGENNLTGLRVRNLLTEEVRDLEVEGLFVFVGYSPNSGFFPGGLALDDAGFIVTNAEMETNLPGIFAAGDVRAKRCRQVTTAVGDGATAANSAFLYLEQLHV